LLVAIQYQLYSTLFCMETAWKFLLRRYEYDQDGNEKFFSRGGAEPGEKRKNILAYSQSFNRDPKDVHPALLENPLGKVHPGDVFHVM
jgi:hypothetical protein